ncbi:hypothetical protein EOA24_39135 [Mesorhizobium sp. M2A.F.Ca.ET.039.01.1.1]|nr:hypothetical protein EOA24_39135 [Mesorhizobium sp. M2A.F.Ca.ET.039.01.1.1]
MSRSKYDELTRECSRLAWAIYDIAWTAFDVLVVGPATDPRSPEVALRRRQIRGPGEPELAPLGGLESAAPQLVRRAAGTHNQPAFLRALRLTAGGHSSLRGSQASSPWAIGEQLVGVVTGARHVPAEAIVYLPWADFAAPSGVLVLQMNGVFIGADWSRDIRNGMLISFAAFIAALFTFGQMFGKHLLWPAFHISLLVRGVSLLSIMRRRVRAAFVE